MSMLVVASEDEKALPPPGEDEGAKGVGNEGVKRAEAVDHQSTAVGDGGGDKKPVGIEGGVGEGEESYYPDEQYADCNQETYGGGQQQYNEEYYYEHDYAKEVEEYLTACYSTKAISWKCVRSPQCLSEGDALREIDASQLVRSDPFVLVHGDVVANMDLLSVHLMR